MNQDCCEHCGSYSRGPDGSAWCARADRRPSTVTYCDKCGACDCKEECFNEEAKE
jgi:hypothetical protein